MTYDEIIQQAGKHLECEFYVFKYEPFANDKIQNDDIKLAKVSFNVPLVGTVMKQVEIETKKRIDTKIPFENIEDCTLYIRASYGENKASKSYDFLYIKEEPTYNADSRTYTYILGDTMIKLMKEYKPISVTYPTTISDFTKALITSQGLYVNDQNFALPNGSIVLDKDPYDGISDFTYRDALDDIAQANGVLFAFDRKYLNIVNYKSRESKKINDDILKSQNISMGEHYGAINVLVLSRSAESDNVYYPSTLPENPIEYKITDNILMNGNNRADFMPKIFENIQGVEYDIYDCELVGYGNFEPLDPITIETLYDGNLLTYQSYVFNYEVTISDGYNEAIYTEKPENTNTDYKVASPDDRLMKNVSLIVDKQNNTINALAEEVGETNSKVAKLEIGIGEVQVEVENITGKPQTIISDSEFKLTNIAEGNGIQYIRVIFTGGRASRKDPYFRFYFQYRDGTGKFDYSYTEPVNCILASTTDVHDEIIYENGRLSVIKRCDFNESGSAYVLSEPYTIDFGEYEVKNPISPVNDYIYFWIEQSSDINFTAPVMYTYNIEVHYLEPSQIATKAELELKVDKTDNDQVVSMINASADIIELRSNRFILNSDYLDINRYGLITMTQPDAENWTGIHIDLADWMDADLNALGLTFKDNWNDLSAQYGDTNWFAKSDFEGRHQEANGYWGGIEVIDGTQSTKYTSTGQVISSDERVKDNIKLIEEQKSIDIIKELKPVEYTYKDTNGTYHRGLLAQDVKRVLENNGIEKQIYKYDQVNDIYSINYTEFIPDLINCIKYQQEEIDNLKQILDNLGGK